MAVSGSRLRLLSREEILQKLNRIAYEIMEDNYDKKEIFILGIRENGAHLSKLLAGIIRKVGILKVVEGSIRMDKKNPVEGKVVPDIDVLRMKGKVVIVVDDVADSGKTLTYALRPFLEVMPGKIRTAVLIDRRHKTFPVSADYVGLSLATTMKEHITVEVKGKDGLSAYLD